MVNEFPRITLELSSNYLRIIWIVRHSPIDSFVIQDFLYLFNRRYLFSILIVARLRRTRRPRKEVEGGERKWDGLSGSVALTCNREQPRNKYCSFVRGTMGPGTSFIRLQLHEINGNENRDRGARSREGVLGEWNVVVSLFETREGGVVAPLILINRNGATSNSAIP